MQSTETCAICFKRLQRLELEGAARFLTFSCYRQRRIFSLQLPCSEFTQALSNYASSGRIELHAWVLMPDHVHLLLTPLERSLDGSLSLFKESVARRLERSAIDRGPIWRPGGGSDRAIVTCGEFREKQGYIHLNPLRADLATTLDAWQWSSWHEISGVRRAGMPTIRPIDADKLAKAKHLWQEWNARRRG